MSAQRNVRVRAVALASIALLAATSACSSAGAGGSTSGSSGGSSAASTVKLAGVLYGISDPYFITIQCGADQAATELGAKIDWKNVTDFDASHTTQAINSAILTKPAGLIVTAEDPLRAVLQGVMDKGIVVSGVNWKSDPASYLQTAITASAEGAIAEAVKMMATDAGESGSVAIFGGKPGNAGMEARWKPVVAGLKTAAPGAKILDTQFEGFETNKTATMVQALLAAHPDLKVIYTTSGTAGQGAIAGVQQAGKQGKVAIYSFDAVPALVAGVKSGDVKALIGQPAGLIGKTAVKAAVDWIKANPNNTAPVKPNDPSLVELPPKLITAENVDSPEAADYEYVAKCA